MTYRTGRQELQSGVQKTLAVADVNGDGKQGHDRVELRCGNNGGGSVVGGSWGYGDGYLRGLAVELRCRWLGGLFR